MQDGVQDLEKPKTTSAESGAGRPGDPSRGPTLLTILPYIMLPMGMSALDSTMVTSALPAIVGSIGGVAHISWIIVASLVSSVIAAPVYGQLRDVVGSRRMMTIALSVFLVASLLCSTATSLGLLVLFRCLQGLGSGGLMTLSQAIIGETIPPLERAKYQGYLSAVMVTSTSLGPIIGGALTSAFGWRSIFLFNVPMAVLALYLSRFAPSRTPTPRSWTFDYVGLFLFVGFIAPFLLALDNARATAASASWPLAAGLFALSMAMLSGLIWQERRAFFPLLPIRFLSERTIMLSDALAACHGATLVSLFTMLPIYLHVVRGANATATGAFLLPVMLGIGTGSMVTGRLVSKTKLTAIFPSLSLPVAALMLVTFALHLESWSRSWLTVNLLLIGATMGSVMGVVQVTVQSAAGRTALGSASASVNISRSIGAAVGTTLTSGVLFASLHFAGPMVMETFYALFQGPGGEAARTIAPEIAGGITAAFRTTFLTIAAFAVVGSVIAWNIPRRHL